MDANNIVATINEVADHVKSYRSELNGFRKEFSAHLGELEQEFARIPTHTMDRISSSASISREAVRKLDDTPAFNHLAAWNQGSARVSLDSNIKAALTTDTGSGGASTMPGHAERGGIVGPVMRSLSLLDVLPVRKVLSDSVEFVQLSTANDADYQVTQGTQKANLDFDGTLKRANIATIAGHTTASRQVLSDSAGLGQKVDQVLRGKIRAKLEYELLNGAGGEGKIDGLISQATTLVPSATIEAPNDVDVIGEALATMRSAGYNPDVILLNPMDWLVFQTMKDADGNYLFGSPASPVSPALWNVVIVQSSSIPLEKVLVLDTSFITLLDREEASVMVSNSHADYFTRNLVAILAELRAGLEVLDTAAVCLVDFVVPAA